jgi:hypothetical protein
MRRRANVNLACLQTFRSTMRDREMQVHRFESCRAHLVECRFAGCVAEFLAECAGAPGRGVGSGRAERRKRSPRGGWPCSTSASRGGPRLSCSALGADGDRALMVALETALVVSYARPFTNNWASAGSSLASLPSAPTCSRCTSGCGGCGTRRTRTPRRRLTSGQCSISTFRAAGWASNRPGFRAGRSTSTGTRSSQSSSSARSSRTGSTRRRDGWSRGRRAPSAVGSASRFAPRSGPAPPHLGRDRRDAPGWASRR